MAVVEYTVPDLKLQTNEKYVATEAFEYMYTEGDLSLLGLDRNRLASSLCFPAVTNAQFTFANAATHAFWRSATTFAPELADADKPKESDTVVLRITTAGLKDNFIGGTEVAQRRAIRDLQAALDPVHHVTAEEVAGDPRAKEFLDKTEEAEPRMCSIVSSDWTSLAATSTRFRSWAMDAFHFSEGTVAEDLLILPKAIHDLSYADWLVGSSLYVDRSEEAQRAWNLIDFVKLYSSTGASETTFAHPVSRDIFNTISADLSLHQFKCPDAISALFNGSTTLAAVNIALFWCDDKFTTLRPFAIKEGSLRSLREFGVYCLSLKQITGTTAERAQEFAMTRMLLVRHGLLHDSQEIVPMNMTDRIAVDMTEAKNFISACRQPEMYYMCLYAAVISFQKSGHHATAANLDNTLQKLLGSISIVASREHVRSLLSSAVYNGTHPASMRLMIAYCHHRVVTMKLSGAIAYRLVAQPPLAVAYHNLEIFMDALSASDFFKVLDRVHEYSSFKDHMKTIRSTMWYVAPYSLYLYNKTAPDPSYAKQEAAKLASYAAAINTALPNTTLVFSPALRKLASQAAVNSISATLLVEGYVDAFRRFFKQTVTRTLTDRKKIRTGEITQ